MLLWLSLLLLNIGLPFPLRVMVNLKSKDLMVGCDDVRCMRLWPPRSSVHHPCVILIFLSTPYFVELGFSQAHKSSASAFFFQHHCAKEVLAPVGIASFLVVWNGLTGAGGYTDLNGVQHEAVINFLPALTLPLTPFTLLSPSLGLLLGK